MFDGDYSFRGVHAEHVNELTKPFDKGNRLFARNLDVYLLAPIVGFLYGKKCEPNNTGETTNILFGAMSKETTTLWFNYRLIMLLDSKNEPDFNRRIDKAFKKYGTENAKPDEELYESYVRGGVEILHEKLIVPSTHPEDYVKNLYEFMEEFEYKYGQNADEIIDLIQLAKS
jgi:hypothetical protein